MTYGYGRGGGYGRGAGGGMGFGFRGASPPWPYIGRGRGGLPRCGYYIGGADAPAPLPYRPSPYPPTPPPGMYPPDAPPMSKDEELNYLNDQAGAIKGQLEEIQKRIDELTKKEEKE